MLCKAARRGVGIMLVEMTELQSMFMSGFALACRSWSTVGLLSGLWAGAQVQSARLSESKRCCTCLVQLILSSTACFPEHGVMARPAADAKAQA